MAINGVELHGDANGLALGTACGAIEQLDAEHHLARALPVRGGAWREDRSCRARTRSSGVARSAGDRDRGLDEALHRDVIQEFASLNGAEVRMLNWSTRAEPTEIDGLCIELELEVAVVEAEQDGTMSRFGAANNPPHVGDLLHQVERADREALWGLASVADERLQ